MSERPRGKRKPPKSVRSAAEYARWFATQGGKARMRTLTPQERREIARKAALTRWRKKRA